MKANQNQRTNQFNGPKDQPKAEKPEQRTRSGKLATSEQVKEMTDYHVRATKHKS